MNVGDENLGVQDRRNHRGVPKVFSRKINYESFRTRQRLLPSVVMLYVFLDRTYLLQY